MVFNSSYAEDCLYCENVFKSRSCVDCTHVPFSESCYDCVECSHCYGLQGSFFCENCSDSFFLRHCQSCRNCFGCANLRHQEYCIFNQRRSKEEYERFIDGIDLSSYRTREHYRQEASDFLNTQPRPHIEARHAENVSGNMIFEARNVRDSYMVRDGEDLRYVFNAVGGVKDCYDYTCYGNKAELLYECVSCGSGCYNSRFCVLCWDGSADLNYCIACIGCSDCFGCIGLHKKQYAVLNKQYSKKEYEAIVPRIVSQMRRTGEWGEFFPAKFSPFPYNHSYAQRFFPLSVEEARSRDLWFYDKETLAREEAVPALRLPDGLPADDGAIICTSAFSGKAFRITTEEIRRYRKLRVPPPRISYDERMESRAVALGGVQLFERVCEKSGRAILSAFSPNEPGVIWSKNCYDQEFS